MDTLAYRDEPLPNGPLFDVRSARQIVQSMTEKPSESFVRVGIAIPASRQRSGGRIWCRRAEE